MTTWDYAVREFRLARSNVEDGGIGEIEAWLKQAGADGWELVSTMPAVTNVEYKEYGSGSAGSHGGERGLERATQMVVILKRAVPEGTP